MKIHEYQGKDILRTFGIPVPRGIPAFTVQEAVEAAQKLGGPVWVVKAQIHAGGRGKGGGVKLARSIEEVKKLSGEILGMQLKTAQTGPEGQKVRRLFIEDGADIKKELYVSVVTDRATQKVAFMASSEGGMDIEAVAHDTPEKIITVFVDPSVGLTAEQGKKLSDGMTVPAASTAACIDVLQKLYKCYMETDSALVEINPLIVEGNGGIKALDAKFNFDSNALFRHPEIVALRDLDEEDPAEIEASKFDLAYISLDGNIGCLVNGAGLAMATMDTIKLYGAEPANFLDVGGGATPEKVTEAFKIMLKNPKVKAIMVNIFGGIMKCDTIATGIITACKATNLSVPLVVRMKGTNEDLGKKMLAESGLPIISADSMAEAAQKVVEATKKATAANAGAMADKGVQGVSGVGAAATAAVGAGAAAVTNAVAGAISNAGAALGTGAGAVTGAVTGSVNTAVAGAATAVTGAVAGGVDAGKAAISGALGSGAAGVAAAGALAAGALKGGAADLGANAAAGAKAVGAQISGAADKLAVPPAALAAAKGGIPWWVWAVLAAIAAFFLLRSCGGGKTETAPVAAPNAPVTAPAVTPAAAPAPAATAALGNWSAKTVDGKLVLEGAVKDQAAKDALLAAAKTSFGDANVLDKLTLDPSLAASSGQAKWGDVFGLLKANPTAAMACNGDKVEFSGDTSGLDAGKLGALLGAGAKVNVAAAPTAAPAASANAAPANAAVCNDKALAADVKFVTGGSAVAAESSAVLQSMAGNLKGCTALKLEIGGHTDNVGKPEGNLKLSQARAESVMAVLVKAGVEAGRISAKGYGDTKPAADNASVEGRQKNRRVEFTAAQ
jgi:succinyl-CoA synthetase beta subunit